MPLTLGLEGSLMVVDDSVKCCGGKTHNFKIDHSIRIHMTHTVVAKCKGGTGLCDSQSHSGNSLG